MLILNFFKKRPLPTDFIGLLKCSNTVSFFTYIPSRFVLNIDNVISSCRLVG